MKKLFHFLFTLVGISLILSCQTAVQPEEVDVAREKEAIMALLNAEAKAAAELDIDTIIAMHVQDEEDSRLQMGRESYTIYNGWKEVEALFESWRDMDMSNVTNIRNSKENVILKVGNNWAWLICDNIWEYDTEGEPVKDVNIQINFLEKIDGEWKFSFQAYIAKPQPDDDGDEGGDEEEESGEGDDDE